MDTRPNVDAGPEVADRSVQARAAVQALAGERFALLRRYVATLAATGIERGLIGPREADRLWERHLLNSLALVDLVPEGATVVDVGSGAGLPGIPLAVVRPDLSVTLLEPLLRRATFLQEVASELDLGTRVRVVRSRAEDHPDAYDVVLARAVAPLDRLIGWTHSLRRPSGQLLALKGASVGEEIAAAQPTLRHLRLRSEVIHCPLPDSFEPVIVVKLTSP